MKTKTIVQLVVVVICFAAAGVVVWRTNFQQRRPTVAPPPPVSSETRAAEQAARKAEREAAKRAAEEAKRATEAANPNRKSEDGWPALVEAAYRGNVQEVKKLLAAGADVNLVGPGDWTALMQAAGCGHAEVTTTLLGAGALVYLENQIHHTAYDLAQQRGHAEAAQLLAAAGAAQDARPLCAAVEGNQLEAAQRLLEQGAPLNGQDGAGRTPLFYALIKLPGRYSEFHHRPSDAVVNWLLSLKPDVNVRDGRGLTVLLAYVSGRDADPPVVQKLLDAGTDPLATDQRGATALHLCTSPEVAELLLKAGVPLNGLDQDGNTPLHRQVMRQNGPVVAWLLAAGADTTVINKRKQTARQSLGERPNLESMRKNWDATQAALASVPE